MVRWLLILVDLWRGACATDPTVTAGWEQSLKNIESVHRQAFGRYF